MKTLHLNLTGKWYDMIESGQKPVEYRDLTAYWTKRLCKYGPAKRGFGQQNICMTDCICKLPACNHRVPTDIEEICFHRGYTKTKMTFKLKTIIVSYGDPKLGAPARQRCFCIVLGERVLP